MKFDYNKLRGRIVENGLTQEQLANKINMSKGTFSQRINNQYHFSQDEIISICKILNITRENIGMYFFNQKV